MCGRVIGAVGYAFGLIASGLFDLPFGAMSLFNRDAHA